MAASTGLTATSSPDEYVQVINSLHQQMGLLQSEIIGLKNGGDSQNGRKNLTDYKSLDQLPKFNGEEKYFSDFEFKLQQFLRPFDNYEMLIDWAKDLDEEPALLDLEEKQVQEQQAGQKSDLPWFNNQLYSILSLICTDDALQVVKNLREEGPTRGFRAWYQLTREVASKSGVRLEKLSDKVHHPKPMKNLHEGLAVLARWKEDLRELTKIQGQPLAEITMRTSMKSMLPEELQHDLEKDSRYKTFAASWKFVQEQIPIRRDWKKNQRRGKDDMDVDAAEAEEPNTLADQPGEGQDVPAEEGDLNSMKGSGKGQGQFQGYCGYCNLWGHKRADCRKKTADMAKGGGDQKGAWKGGKGEQKGYGDWSQKGGQWGKGKNGGKNGWGKGKGKWSSGPKGGGFQGMLFNVDGEYEQPWGQQPEAFYNGGQFFGCLLGCDDDESDMDDDLVCLPCDRDDESECCEDLLMMAEEDAEDAEETVSTPKKYATFADMLKDHNNNNDQRSEDTPEPPTTPKKNPAVRLPKKRNVRESPESTSAGESPSVESPITESPVRTSPSCEPIAEQPAENNRDSEVEISETDWGLGDEEDDNVSITSCEMPRIVDSSSEEEDDDNDDDDDEEFLECRSDSEFSSDLDIRDARDVVARFSGEDEFLELGTRFSGIELIPDEKVFEDIVCLLEKLMPTQQLARVLGEASPTGSSAESVGTCLPTLMKPGMEGTIKEQDAIGQPPEAKLQPSAKKSRKDRWKTKRTQARLDLVTGDFKKFWEKEFEEMSVRELRQGYDSVQKLKPLSIDEAVSQESRPDIACPPGVSWIDGEEIQKQERPAGVEPMECPEVNCFFDIDAETEDTKQEGDLMNMSWKSEPEEWNRKKWVKVKSIMDSGASAPVAPPDMLPNVTIRESPGSKRGQRFSSASKHKLKNLGEQRILACTEEGEATEVLFQIADISKPLVSVSAICERGNRVLFGKAGGVVINIKSGKQIPFYKENGVYVLSMWMQDADASFRRQ